ncbi:MAG: hypothetical protein AAFN79_17200 [Pseudomonadota bacterium]
MTDQKTEPPTPQSAAGEVRGHLAWLDTFTPLGLAVLAAASGVYTYLGVSGLLEKTGALSFFAAVAYSVAVSVGIFIFWSYLLRLFPAMTRASSRIGLLGAMALGSAAIVAMSSWLNAAALAGSAAVEQHLARTVQEYQEALERAHSNAISAQALARDVARARENFENLSEQEAAGTLSGVGGQGAVYRLLLQKAAELTALEAQIAAQDRPIREAFEEGNETLSGMRELIAAQGPVEARSIAFAELSVRLAGDIASLRQLSVAPLVARASEDLRASVVLPELDGRTAGVRDAQSATISSVLEALDRRAETLSDAAREVLRLPPPQETTYTPISTADAVIRYAGNFMPSWAGAIAIDLLPGVLVLILAVAQAAIREEERGRAPEASLTLADLEVALAAARRIEAGGAREETSEPPKPGRLRPVERSEGGGS